MPQPPAPRRRASRRLPAVLFAVLRRWRDQARDPIWEVEVAWVRGVRREHGLPLHRLHLPEEGVVRMELDADLSDQAAVQLLHWELLDLLMDEVHAWRRAVPYTPPRPAGWLD